MTSIVCTLAKESERSAASAGDDDVVGDAEEIASMATKLNFSGTGIGDFFCPFAFKWKQRHGFFMAWSVGKAPTRS